MRRIGKTDAPGVSPSRPALTPSYATFRPASEAASAAMRSNRAEGGKAERALRSAVWRQGLRFRTHVAELPGKPDLVFASRRLCVFCDGDFWHGRNWPVLRRQLQARANSEYWVPKIQRNLRRDRRQEAELRREGWTVLRFWETDVLRSPEAVARILRLAMSTEKPTPT